MVLPVGPTPLPPIARPSSPGRRSPPPPSDSLAPHPLAPPPTSPWRKVSFNLLIALLHLIALPLVAVTHLYRYFADPPEEKKVYEQLHQVAQTNPDLLPKRLQDESKGDAPFRAPLSHLHQHPSFLSSFLEIMQGANVLLKDGGHYFHLWKTCPAAHPRISSHKHRPGECYQIGHFLFWRDLLGNTRFQYERSPFLRFFDLLPHTFDYLRYCRDNQQQGIMGNSLHTEGNPLIFEFLEEVPDEGGAEQSLF